MYKSLSNIFSKPLVTTLVVLAFLLTFAIMAISSYIRLHEAGIGCENWPDCYSQINLSSEVNPLTPEESLKKIHRLVATILVVIILAIALQSFRHSNGNKRARKISLYMIAILVALSVIGPYSGLKQYPIIATSNIVLGMSLLCLIALYWWNISRTDTIKAPALKTWTGNSIVLLLISIILGAWGSTNYASFTDYVPAAENIGTLKKLIVAFSPTRELSINNNQIIADAAIHTIRNLHLTISIIAAFLIVLIAMVTVWQHKKLRAIGIAILCLIFIESISGVSAMSTATSLPNVLGHHLLAAILLLLSCRLYLSLSSH